MSYSDDKGKYQKAYDFLYSKLIPPQGSAKNALGEALRLVSRAYYRKNNDGDTYGDCIEEGMIPDFSKYRCCTIGPRKTLRTVYLLPVP